MSATPLRLLEKIIHEPDATTSQIFEDGGPENVEYQINSPYSRPSNIRAVLLLLPLVKASQDLATSASTKNTPDDEAVSSFQHNVSDNVSVQVVQGNSHISNKEDAFAGIELPQTAQSNVAPPLEPLLLGSLIAGGRSKRKQLRKEEPIPQPEGEFNDENCSQPHLNTQKARDDRRDQPLTPEEELNDPLKTPVVRIRMFTNADKNDYYAHFDISIIFTWIQDDTEHQSQITFILWHDNCHRIDHSTLAEIRAAFHQVSEERLSGQAEGLQALVTDYKPGRYGAHAVNATSPTDFGPWADTVEHLRSFILHGARIHIAASGLDIPYKIKELNAELLTDRRIDPHTQFWDHHHKSQRYRHERLKARTKAPRVALSSRVSYRNIAELMTFETRGLVHEEEFVQLRATPERSHHAARFLGIPGRSNDNILLMVVQDEPDCRLNFEEGDRVNVRIRALNPMNNAEDDWTGTVNATYPGVHTKDQVIVIRRPYDMETQNWRGRDVSALRHLHNISDIAEGQTAHDILNKSAPHAVDIAMICDSQGYRRMKHILGQVYDVILREKISDQAKASATEDLVLANRFDRQRSLNILEHWTQEEIDVFRKSLGDAQGSIIDAMQTMLGGTLLVQGPAGAGKSHVFCVFLQHSLLRLRAQSVETDIPRRGLRALIATPINNNADQLLKSLHELFGAVAADFIVIRQYTKLTNRALIMQGLEQASDRICPANFDADELIEQLRNATNPARQLGNEFERRQRRLFEPDQRVTKLGMTHSLAEYLALAMGIKDRKPDSPSEVAIDRVRRCIGSEMLKLATATWHRMKEEKGSIIREQQVNFSMMLRKMNDCILQASDAVVTTMQQAADPNLYLGFRPDVFIIDEAAKVTSVESLAFAWYPGCHFRILVGDMFQSRPQVNSPPSYNGSARQLELSLFTRLRLAGFPALELYEQHRFGPGLAAMLSFVSYPFTITAAKTVAVDPSRAKAMRLWDLFGHPTKTEVTGPPEVVLIDVSNTHEQVSSISRSRSNRRTALVTWHYVDALRAHGYTPEEIGILTPYAGQRTMHENIAAGERAGDSTIPPDFMVESSQRAQSLQREVLIFDIPNTESLGFMTDTNRLTTALSRCRHCLIIVADFHALVRIKGYHKGSISKVFEWITEHGVRRRAPQVDDNHPRTALMPLDHERELVTPQDAVNERVMVIRRTLSANAQEA